MDRELRILILEDTATDAELMERELRRGGVSFSARRVASRESFVTELDADEPDLILADYALPSFDGMAALAIARDRCPEVPFLFVSGAIGEESAIETLKRGATDYVLKQRMARLVPSVRRALREAEERLQRRRSEQQFRDLLEAAPDAMVIVNERGEILLVNLQAERLFGYTREELVGRPVEILVPAAARTRHREHLAGYLARPRARSMETGLNLYGLRKDGTEFPAEISLSPLRTGEGILVSSAIRDTTERQRAEEALQRSERWHRARLEVTNAIITMLERGSLFDAIARALQQFVSFDRGSLALLDPAGDMLRVFGLAGTRAVGGVVPLGSAFPRQGSHLAGVLEEKRPLIRRDLEAEQRVGLEEDLLKGGIRSYVAVPLVAKGRVLGTLNIGSEAPHRYSDEDATCLQEIAPQIALALENMLAYEEIAALKARLERENVYLQEEIKSQHNFEEIIGRGPAISKVLRAVETVAPTDASVLILGETGTGKELVAQAIHNLSPRKRRALVKVNCAALPAGLIESELFGHEKGAFTGALARKVGRFELADGGTIFLDEIADLPLDLQAKLLRVLQEGRFERVGGSPTLRVDVRVIAATNQDLENATQEGRFRPDLYYRLNVFPIQLPPLRERPEDIPLLVRYFVMRYSTKLGKRIDTVPQETMDALRRYPWPGNVRELENVIERAAILSRGPRLDLGDWLPKARGTPPGARPAPLQEVERAHIIETLELTGWQVSGGKGAARLLGLKPTTLEARMRKLGIRRPE